MTVMMTFVFLSATAAVAVIGSAVVAYRRSMSAASPQRKVWAASPPEVYYASRADVASETSASAVALAANLNGVVATRGQLEAAAKSGASWSEYGWIAEDDGADMIDAQMPVSGAVATKPPLLRAPIGVVVYGIKPPTEALSAFPGLRVAPFNQKNGKWNEK